MFKILNLKTLYLNILLYLFKTDLPMFKPHHSYNIRLKMLGNLNCIKVNRHFGEFNIVNVGIDLWRKLNINISNFKRKSMLINYLHTLDLNNVNF